MDIRSLTKRAGLLTALLALVTQTGGTVALAAATPNYPVVLGARIGEYPDRTRFVVEVSDPLRLRVFTLSNPNRVVADMPQVLWHLGAPERTSRHGVVKSYRYGLFRPGDSRFVIDLNRPVTVGEPMIISPRDGFGYRIVLDLVPTSQAQFEMAAGWPADLKAREGAAERSATAIARGSNLSLREAGQRKVVVLDAGHGGVDSGAKGVTGLQEKDLVLDEVLRTAKALTREGYKVLTTRSSDVYIPLRERIAIARSDHADLFISLHADSNPDSSVHGASVYTLSESGSDKEAAALARKENQSDVIAGVDLTGEDTPVASILIDLAQRDTINHSARFAQAAVSELSHATDIIARDPHRSAAFAVLKAPDVPAVLIELGYLSNSGDAAQMDKARWRENVASAIVRAVDRQFGRNGADPITRQAISE